MMTIIKRKYNKKKEKKNPIDNYDSFKKSKVSNHRDKMEKHYTIT